MSRLKPSHPIARFGEQSFIEHIDVLGPHLIWTGAMSIRQDGDNKRYAKWTPHKDEHYQAVRVAWELVKGEKPSDDFLLVRHCVHERCIAPDCHQYISKVEHFEATCRVKRKGYIK